MADRSTGVVRERPALMRWAPADAVDWRPPLTAAALSALGVLLTTVAVLTQVTRHLDAVTLPPLRELGAQAYGAGAGFWLWRTIVWGGQFGLMFAVTLAVAAVVGLRHRSWRPLLVTGAALVALNVVTWVLKWATGRTAPGTGTDLLHVGAASYSSGHTAVAATCLPLVTAMLTARRGGDDGVRGLRLVADVLTWAAVVLVGISTLTLGYHWLTDVVAGWLTGTMVVPLCVAALGTRRGLKRPTG